MAGKQQQYLADLLADEPLAEPSERVGDAISEQADQEPSPALSQSAPRHRGTTLLGRESALARVASGEVRQITRMHLNPDKVSIWPGNARNYSHLTEENCRDLIDAIVAEGGQRIPAVARRVDGDPKHDFEVIIGTRRHFAISWLRANSYPDFTFVADIASFNDETAFRLADIENRARKDISDLERARNYAAALTDHYGGQLRRMAERLKVSPGWLSKMVKVAGIPDAILAAFSSPADVQLKTGYILAQALDDKAKAKAIATAAKVLATEQGDRHAAGQAALASADVFKRLLAAVGSPASLKEAFSYTSKHGREALSVVSNNRNGVTVRLHAGAGADPDELAAALVEALAHLEATGQGFRP